MTTEDKKRERAEALRYKRPALASMGFDIIITELDEISEKCDDIRWAMDDVTQPVMDGDADDGCGFRVEFTDLGAECDQLRDQLYDTGGEMFDDCTVALIGNRFELIGYDAVETDYFHLCAWDAGRATTEAGKRLMRLTKQQMIDTIGRSVGIMMAFYDLRQRYDYLNAAISVLLDHNLDTLHQVHTIEDAYRAWCDDGCKSWGDKFYDLERQCNALDDVYWIA